MAECVVINASFKFDFALHDQILSYGLFCHSGVWLIWLIWFGLVLYEISERHIVELYMLSGDVWKF